MAPSAHLQKAMAMAGASASRIKMADADTARPLRLRPGERPYPMPYPVPDQSPTFPEELPPSGPLLAPHRATIHRAPPQRAGQPCRRRRPS